MNRNFMDLEGTIDIIETTSKENAWALIEQCQNSIERCNLRNLFFEALKELQLHFNMPKDTWEN